jgi:hypothetical protein
MQAEAQPLNEIPKYTFITIGCAQFKLIVFLKSCFSLLNMSFVLSLTFKRMRSAGITMQINAYTVRALCMCAVASFFYQKSCYPKDKIILHML